MPGNGGSDSGDFAQSIDAVLAPLEASEPDQASPYFGPLKAADDSEVGTFLLSTCGCGYWRAYAHHGDQKLDVRISFPQFPRSFSTFENDVDQPASLVGKFVEGGDTAFGELQDPAGRSRFQAQRMPDQPTLGCITCHVIDGPPRPLPATHRPVTASTNCLECHSVAGF